MTALSGDGIGLAQAISRVREELLIAQQASVDKDIRFRLGEVRVDFAVEMTLEGGAELGVKLWVVNFNAKGTATSTKTHTVSVAMVPQVKNAAGQWDDVRVSDTVEGRPPLASDR